MNLAERMSHLKTESAFVVLKRARELEQIGKHIIHLEIGEPDFPTPKSTCEAGIKAIGDGFTKYEPAQGILPLREAIAEDIQRTRGVSVHPDQVVITPGAKPIMFFAILATVNPGDEVIYPNPGFPVYESVIDFVDAKPVPVPLLEENNFRLDIDDLKKVLSPKTRMIILNSPQNPTGGMLEKEDLEGIAKLTEPYNVIILTDEIYKDIIYDGEFHSIYSIPGIEERTIILDGFSKSFSMTGWRLGYGVMPKDLASQMALLMINSNSCTASFTQKAGITALKESHSEIDHMVGEFKRRRDVIVEGLNRIPGFSCKMPPGAFYVFPNIRKTGKTAKELEQLLLESAGVATLAGSGFGKYGEGHLRFSYANSLENITEALKRIERTMSSGVK